METKNLRSVISGIFLTLTTNIVLIAGEPLSVEGPVLDLQNSFAAVATKIKPTVVSITATHVETIAVPQFFFGDPNDPFNAPPPRSLERRSQGLGSGVVVDSRGYILTNEHVVRGANELIVTFQTPVDKKYTGRVVGADPRSDLAVIKIDAKEELPVASLANSDQVRVGDWAVAVGSPFGLEQTVTVGIISAVRQSLNLEGAVYSGLLQTDAAINRGNSGGPLVNIRGEVMGINTAIYAPTGVFAGIGFAIPSNRVKDIMDQLISQGRVSRGWMGVEILSVNSVIADQFGLEKPEGVMINNVAENSPASRAGLRRGDVVVDFDGQPTPTQDVLLDLVGKMKPTSTVRVGIIREKQKRTVSLTLAETPSGSLATPLTPDPTAPPIKSLDWEGARIGSLTPTLASRLGVPIDIQGVVVVSMPSAGGLANDLGLREGDVVVAVNRHPTPTVTMFQKIIKNLSAKEGLLLDVNRRGRQIFLSYQSGE